MTANDDPTAKRVAGDAAWTPRSNAAVDTMLTRCLAVEPGENVLIIADTQSEACGRAIRAGAQRIGADAVLAIMDERAESGTEPPATLAAALSGCDVFLLATTRSLTHTNARRNAVDAGARGASLPAVTEDMLIRGLSCDIDAVLSRSRACAEALDGATTAHVTCPRGTDLTLDLAGREGRAEDGGYDTPGRWGNLPAGEGYIAPLSGDGVIVASSIAGLGIADPPARLTVRDGHIVNASTGLGSQLLEQLRAHHDAGTNLAELGVGTNETARMVGTILEDEKILGSIHIAFGASAGIGGTVNVPIHIDVVVPDATLTLDHTQVIDAGRWTL